MIDLANSKRNRRRKERRIRRAMKRIGDKCIWCHCDLNDQNRTLEHIISLGRGGTWSSENLALACYSCNSAKGMFESQGNLDEVVILESGIRVAEYHYLADKPKRRAYRRSRGGKKRGGNTK